MSKITATPEEVNAMVKNLGGYRQTARQLGVCAATVYNYLKRYGLAGSHPQRAKPHPLLPHLNSILADYRKPMPVIEVAQKHGVSYTSIINLLRRYARGQLRDYATRHKHRANPVRQADPHAYDLHVKRCYARKKYAADPLGWAAYQRRWRAQNPGAARRYVKEWAAKNTERARVHNRNRRARINGVRGYHTARDIHMLYEYQGGCCAYCNKPLSVNTKRGYHVDHRIPLSRGGTNWPDNLALTCASCNHRKWTYTDVEFMARIRGKGRTAD